MKFLLGLDIGTTNIKAIIINEEGTQTAFAREASPFVPLGEHYVLMPEDLWDNVCNLISKVITKFENSGNHRKDIAGVAVASMAEMGIPLNNEGPLFPAIAWYDPCTVPQAERLKRDIGADRVQDITGQGILHIFTISKQMWLKDHFPDVFESMEKWACISDYISLRLGGRLAMSHSIAARTGMLNYQNLSWSQEIIEGAGLDLSKLPKLAQSGTQVGVIDDAVSSRTRLFPGTGVFVGGHDHVCAALACGVVQPGVFMDSIGTSEALITTAPNVQSLNRAGRAGFNIGPHAKTGAYYLMGSVPASGASVDWYQHNFSDANDVAMDSQAGRALPGGLCFLPHLRGGSSPVRNVESRAAFLGIRDTHTHDDFLQAVYEGLGFEVRSCIDRMCATSTNHGLAVKRIVCTGGGTKNDRWLQTKADILGYALEVPRVQEATAMGAALLSGIGASIYKDADDAVQKTYFANKVVEPNRSLKGYYDAKFEVFESLYDLLLETNTTLEQLTKKYGNAACSII